MEGLKLIPYIALILAIAGIVLGAAVIVNSKFKDTMENDGCYNASFTKATVGCVNSSSLGNESGVTSYGKSGLNLSSEGYSIYQAQQGLKSVSEQQPTIAIIAVMVIIISIIAGVFVYMRYFS